MIFLSSLTRGWAEDKPSVTIHNLIDLTGRYAPISVPCEKGGKDYLAWIADQGGLDVNQDGKGDVEIKYVWAETGNDPSQFMAAYKRFRMGRARFSIVEMISYPKPRPLLIELWPPPNHEIKPILERDGAVGYGIAFDDHLLYPPAWNFANVSEAESAAGAIEYFIDHLWPKKNKNRKAKMVHLVWSMAYGQATQELIKRHGNDTGKYEVVAERSFKEVPTDQEVGEFLHDLEKEGIDIIWSSSTVETSAAIVKGVAKLGLSKKIFILTNFSAPADQLLEIVGPQLAEAYICAQPVFIPSAEPEAQGVKFAKMLNEKYRRDPRMPNTLYMHGIWMKANILESVRRALVGIMKRDNIDLPKACKWISGKEVKEFGLQTLAGYSAHQTTAEFQSAPSSKDDRRLANYARLIGVKEGKVTILSPWYKVPRLIPEDMIRKGLFKDETINIHYLPVK